jgi:outer membrane protein insertion porin family
MGGGLSLGLPLREDLGLQLRYSVYQQTLSLNPALMDCSPANPPPTCFANGEASLAIKQAVLNGTATVSLIGYGLTYNTLDNNKNPHSGLLVALRQDFAGVGGDVDFIKSSIDARYYHEVFNDVVGVVRGQAGYVTAWGGQQLRMLDNFFGGPNLVRGFQVNGFGPRDLTVGTTQDSLGGTKYWAATAELQSPIPNLPKDIGLKVAVFADAGALWDYQGQVNFPAFGQSLTLVDPNTGINSNAAFVRSAVGAGLIWESPFGPLRFDYAIPITKQPFDIVQQFRFSGGTKF